jgi:hypothetical protein
VLTTPEDPSEGVESRLAELLGREGVQARQVGTIVHGTTLVTNALIERRGARMALLTTEGFKDALAIGTEHRYDMYDVFIEKPEPLAPRSLRYGVRERSLDDGSVMLGARRRAGPFDRLGAARTRRAGGRRELLALFPQPRARTEGRGDPEGGGAGDLGLALFGGRAEDPGVRAHLDDGRQRVHQAAGRGLSDLPRRPTSAARFTLCSRMAVRPA